MIIYERQHLESSLMTLWNKNGFPVIQLETGDVPLASGGKMLCINFIPEVFTSWSVPDEIVRLSIVTLVGNRVTKQFCALQWAVNAKRMAYEKEQYVVVAKYWCNSDKLRWLEKRWFPFVNPLRHMPLNAMITDRDFRGFDPDRLLQELATTPKEEGKVPSFPLRNTTLSKSREGTGQGM
mgnify:CR=1 FL=1